MYNHCTGLQFAGDEQVSLRSMREKVSLWTAAGGGGEEEDKPQPQPRMVGPPRPGHSREMESGPVIGPMLPQVRAGVCW